MTRYIFIAISLLFLVCPVIAQQTDRFVSLDQEIEILKMQGAFDSALQIADRILEEDSLYIPALLSRYELYRNKNKINSAYRIARDNYKLFKDKIEGIDQIKLYLHRAEAYMLVRKIEKGLKVLDVVEALLAAIQKEHSDLLHYNNYIKGLYFSNAFGRHDPKTENTYLSTFAALEASPNPSPYLLGQLLRKLGITNQSRGDFDKAKDYFQKELAIYHKYYSTDHFDVGVAHYSTGGLYYELMEYQKALDHYLPAYEIWKNHYKPSDKYMRHLTEAIGDMYWELGQKEASLPFYNLSVVDKKNVKHPKLEEVTVADSLASNKQFEKAMGVYETALNFRKETYGDKHPVTGACQNQIARAYLSKGDYNQALHAYQLALTMLINDFNDKAVTANPDKKMQVMSEQYLLESMVGKTQTLKEIYDQSLDIKDLDLAFETAQQAIDILEKLRQSPLAESSKSFWTRKYFSLFDITLELAYARFGNSPSFIEIAFPIIENSKALLLQNALRFNRESTFLDIPEQITKKEKQIKKAIREYVIRIEQEERLCENAQLNKVESWNQELLDLKLEYNIFLDELKNNYPKYFNLKYDNQSLEITEIKKRVLKNKKSLLVEYFEGEHFIYTLAFSQEKSFAFRIKKDSLFKQQLHQFTSSLYDVEEALKKPQQYFDQFKSNSAALYQQLLKTVLDHFPDSINQLFLIPDKQLFYLPFECLLTNDAPSANDYRQLPYLLNKYQISYSQSAEVLAWAYSSNQTKQFKYNYLGYAPNQFTDEGKALDQLHWNEKEVLQAGKVWNGKTLVNNSATRKNFLKYAALGKIQHLATHALIDNENPMLSRIILQGDSSNLLFTYDLYSLPVRSELVVLSACNTGRGKWQQGEGMISLERAFQYTGCPSLLTSTWTIDDEASSVLTINFFDFLKKGYPKHEALALAKKGYLAASDPAFAHPYYWAGLRLTGNMNPVIMEVESKKEMIWIVALIVVLIVGWFGFSSTGSGATRG